MPNVLLRAITAGALLTWASTPLDAQAPVATRTLVQPEVELSEPFSRLMGVRELADGRLIVTDMIEKAIAVVDLTRRNSTKIGGVGQGPGEYMMPTGVIAIPGDSTLVVDAGGGKYLKLSPSGAIVGDVPFPQATTMTGPGGGRMSFSVGGGPGNSDAAGRLYSRGSNFRMSPDGQMSQSDSAPIIRYDWRAGKSDTVTFVGVAQAQVQTSSRGGGTDVQVRMGAGNTPFTAQPAWAVAPDGRIAVVTPEPYRVTWVSPTGQKTAGAPITYQRVRVTDAEKAAYREAFKASPPTGIAVRVDNNSRSTTSTTVPFTEPASWPEFKHPYAGTAGNVSVAPTGELWVLRQLPHTERNPTYDVFGARGEITGRIVIPQRTRLLGFGKNGAIYLVRRDADDLEYIQRHRLAVGR